MSNVEFKYDIALGINTHTVEPVVRNTRKDGTGENITYDAAYPTWFMANLIVADLETAKQIAATFPKFVKIKASTIASYEMGTTKIEGCVKIDILMCPTLKAGASNEAGIRRIKGFFKTCEKHGYTVTRVMQWGNSSPKSVIDYGWACL